MTRWIWNRTQGIVTDFSGYTLADHLTMDARREELKAIAAERRERQERERAERIAQNRVLLALWDSIELEGFALDCHKLHSPINGGDDLSCSHCEGVDEDGYLELADWPCATAGLLIQHYGKDGR